MPKGFTDREKEAIRKKLMEKGAVLFKRLGIRKTSVDDIVRAAGISKGSFYAFYESKEDLLFEIIEGIEAEYKAKVFGDIFPEGRSRKQSFKDFLNGFLVLMNENMLLGTLDTAEIERLMQKLPAEKLARHMKRDIDVYEEFYKTWRDRGVFRDLDIKGFIGVLKLLFTLVIQRERSEPGEFEATLEMYIDMICEYVIEEGEGT